MYANLPYMECMTVYGCSCISYPIKYMQLKCFLACIVHHCAYSGPSIGFWMQPSALVEQPSGSCEYDELWRFFGKIVILWQSLSSQPLQTTGKIELPPSSCLSVHLDPEGLLN